jgi:C4-dicarboxylate-specific signal transduction histidine kinase
VSQPFDVVAVRRVSWRELPWLAMLGWAFVVTVVLAGLRFTWQSRLERRRAEELLRLGQVGRLNALGELAAGMAHELNQPLTALLASTQAAGRLLREVPPDLETAHDAMTQAAGQARRAADVVGRLRRVIEKPDSARRVQPVNLQEAARNALYLVEPECLRRGVTPVVAGNAGPVYVMAEPIALEQIIYNLLINALQALEQVPLDGRSLRLEIGASGGKGVLAVSDSGPGIAPEVLPRIFEPFVTSREGGLGLGLSLCESLAARMGGALSAADRAPHGATFTLQLPLTEAR